MLLKLGDEVFNKRSDFQKGDDLEREGIISLLIEKYGVEQTKIELLLELEGISRKIVLQRPFSNRDAQNLLFCC